MNLVPETWSDARKTGVVEGMWDDILKSWWYDKIEGSLLLKLMVLCMLKALWQAYVYILLKRYDDSMEAILRPCNIHGVGLFWSSEIHHE